MATRLHHVGILPSIDRMMLSRGQLPQSHMRFGDTFGILNFKIGRCDVHTTCHGGTAAHIMLQDTMPRRSDLAISRTIPQEHL